MSDAIKQFTLASGEGRTLPTPAGGQVTFKVLSEDSSGAFSLLEFNVPAGAGPRLHVHEATEECIYVLQGQLQIQLGDAVHDADAGSCIFIPAVYRTAFATSAECLLPC